MSMRLRISAHLVARLAVLPGLLALPTTAGADSSVKVSLQLKWRHQFQFAGYYAAQAEGFYAQEGFEVAIFEGDEKRRPVEQVLAGKADYGVSDADVLLGYLQGRPLVALGVIFQHSPYILLTRADSGIRAPSDLRGRTIMLDDEQGIVQIKAMFRREGIPLDAVRVLRHAWKNEELIEGRVDAISAYSTVEPFQMRARGVEPGMVRAMDYGIDFYGDTLFTTRSTAEADPGRVDAFRRASFRGWEYAMAHPEKVIDLILAMPGVQERGITRELLRFEAAAMRNLVLPDLVDIGHMNPGRWEMIARVYADVGSIDRPPDSLDGFLFDPDRANHSAWLRSLLIALGAALVFGAWILFWNMRLQRVVAQRTAELRRSRDRLEQAEQRLRYHVENSPLAVIEWDHEFRLTRWTGAAEHVFGWKAEELLGKHPREWAFIPEQDCSAVTLVMDRLARGDQRRNVSSNCNYRKDGSIIHCEWYNSALLDENGQRVSVLSLVLDVTQRKRAEATLRDSERQLHATFEQAAVGMAHVGLDGRWLRLNQQLCNITGYSREELQARTFQDITHPDDLEADLAQARRLLSREIDHYILEKRYIRPDGSPVWVTLSASLLCDDSGRPERYVAVVQDISGRKQTEEELRKAKEAADAANHAKDHFLAVLSHELRTPLTPVLTAVQMMEEEPGLSPETRETLSMIRRNVALEARLIDDLLDLTRLSRGKLALHLEPLDLHEKIRHVVRICEDDARAKGLDVQVELGARRARVQADPARLQQIIWNLLRNAIKFTPAGGRIRLATAEPASGQVEITVEDNGVGIEPALLPHIFDPFEQGGPDVTRLFGGMGLGLSITRGLVDLHGGSIVAESPGKGRGATFRVRLPLLNESAAERLPEPSNGTGHHLVKSGRILLVEDHPDTANILQRLLRRWGYDVTTAGNVATGLRMAQAAPFDLLISDLGLPDGTGHDLMRQLTPLVPLRGIALSGYGQEEDIRRSRAAGFSEHLVKPVDFMQLREAVNRLTQAH